jgi:UDP:flavonoid glycosyltransferase YjiC (YdhE family)
MKILFASLPADGHFNPLTGIAGHLSGQGHDVRWYAGPQYGRKLEALGMVHFPYRRASEITGANPTTCSPSAPASGDPS